MNCKIWQNPTFAFYPNAGLEDAADLVVFEEIKFEPKVMCNQLDRRSTLVSFELEDGDIICFQRSGPKPEADGEGEAMLAADRAEPAYPSVIDFFQYVKNRQIVVFKKLENPKVSCTAAGKEAESFSASNIQPMLEVEP